MKRIKYISVLFAATMVTGALAQNTTVIYTAPPAYGIGSYYQPPPFPSIPYTDTPAASSTGSSTQSQQADPSTSSTFDSSGLTQTQKVPLVPGTTQTTTTIVEQDHPNETGVTDAVTMETQTTSPSLPNDEMPAWEQALQPKATTTTTTQDIETRGKHTDVTTVEKQITVPSRSDVPAWEQALQPSETTTVIVNQKDVITSDQDEITTMQSQTIGPIPAWDEMLQSSGSETAVDEETMKTGAGNESIIEVDSGMHSPVPAGGFIP